MAAQLTWVHPPPRSRNPRRPPQTPHILHPPPRLKVRGGEGKINGRIKLGGVNEGNVKELGKIRGKKTERGKKVKGRVRGKVDGRMKMGE